MNDLSAWVNEVLGVNPRDLGLYERAFTHSSVAATPTYERLEFLGDRVLGLVVADWLYREHPDDPEGKLSTRLNMLVARKTCADVGRSLSLSSRIRLGKQALDDGAFASDNVIGDVVEALIGAVFVDHGLEGARAFITRVWQPYFSGEMTARLHPKSALQEWAAAHNRKPPAYTVLDRSGPDHSPRFRIKVSLGSAGEAEAEGKSKQEAESEAAKALLSQLGS